ncbi:hypothetical protein [Kineosporia succinea]|uniref:Uncharacterized protein n=1 Tax=Kineosporia succinea TaxID=84632 RepID=A0ABT9P5R2_9ACTN|nr:hypothetical protein [Kineosporia succinea]MDP9828036.1 hypothetical protein [Kineosporia succinea]
MLAKIIHDSGETYLELSGASGGSVDPIPMTAPQPAALAHLLTWLLGNDWGFPAGVDGWNGTDPLRIRREDGVLTEGTVTAQVEDGVLMTRMHLRRLIRISGPDYVAAAKASIDELDLSPAYPWGDWDGTEAREIDRFE